MDGSEVSSNDDIENWVSCQLFKRVVSTVDPYAQPIEDYISGWELPYPFITLIDHDSLVTEIFETFDDYETISTVRMMTMMKCRFIFSSHQKRCFELNMHSLAMWSIENARIRSQVRAYLLCKLPFELVRSMVPSELITKPKPVKMIDYLTSLRWDLL